MTIKTENAQSEYSEAPAEFKPYLDKLCDAVLSDEIVDFPLIKALKESYLTVTYVDEEQIKQANSDNRGIDKVTDVLSFPMQDMENGKLIGDSFDYEYDKDGNTQINLGDCLVCLKRAEEQAAEYGHSLTREVVFLVAHSILHLLGYDHMTDTDEARMIRLQKMLMRDVGLATEEEIQSLENDVIDEEEVNFPAGTLCKHCGYVAFLGRPNVGKSTLLNYITGMKVAIVSHKPQTTRTNIKSIYNTEDTQIIFVDTPGVHNPGSKMSKYMVDKSFAGAKGADIVLMLVDARFGKPGSIEKRLAELCVENKKRVILAINKADEISGNNMLPVIAEYSGLMDFVDIVPISAKTGENVDVLLNLLAENLPEGPRLYDSLYMTDQTEREISAELIREQILHYTDQEIPHGVAVEITKFEEKYDEMGERNLAIIDASVICDRDSHKAIIIGKGGQMLKRIGSVARKNIENMLDCKVYLDLYVKVRKDWKNNDIFLNQFGLGAEDDE